MGKNSYSETGLSSNHVKDLRGKRCGKVIVVSFDHTNEAKTQTYWKCQCDCGNTTVLSRNQLLFNTCPNCGCTKRNANRPKRLNVKTHHMTGSRIYHIWKSMRYRCSTKNKESRDYRDYVLRNIKVCEEWQNNFESFYQWAMSNGYRDDLSIDRIDNDGDYCPENCRWVSNTVQQRNRRKTVYLTYKGQTKALSEWCEIYGLKMKTCYGRLHQYGWTNPQDILFGKGGTVECPRIY